MNTSSASESSCGLGPRAWLPPLLWGLGAGFAAAAATVLFVLTKLPLPLRAVAAVLPLLPSLGYIFCIVRMLRRVDELQRRIQLEAIGFAFAATVIVAMLVDLLEQAKIVPAIHWGWAGLWTAMALLWALGNVIASRRYR
jgi:hypothetical protein